MPIFGFGTKIENLVCERRNEKQFKDSKHEY